MEPEEAIEILSRRGDQVAVALDVAEGPGWRNNTGTAHLLIRGGFQSLERISAGEYSVEGYNAAAQTVDSVDRFPNGFLNKNMKEVAAIAKKILETEKRRGSLAEAVTTADLDLLASDLQSFRNDIVGQAGHEDADPSLKAFAGALSVANVYYQRLANDWKAELGGVSAALDGSFVPEQPAS